jgi:hypothetical protein
MGFRGELWQRGGADSGGLGGGKYNIKQPLNKNFVKKILAPD